MDHLVHKIQSITYILWRPTPESIAELMYGDNFQELSCLEVKAAEVQGWVYPDSL